MTCRIPATKPQRPRLPEETQHDRTPRYHEGKAPLLEMVGKGRQGRVRAPLLDAEPGGPAAHVRRTAGHRHRQYLQSVQSLPDRKNDAMGKSVDVGGDLGGRRLVKKKKKSHTR